MLCDNYLDLSKQNDWMCGLTRLIGDSDWFCACVLAVLATLLVFADAELCGTVVERFLDGKVSDYIWIFVAFDNFSFGRGEGSCLELIIIFIELEIESLLLSAARLRLGREYGETAAWGRRIFLVSSILFLFKSFNFLVIIGGCSDLRHLAFNLISATALGWGLRPRIIQVALVDIDLRTVYFAAVDLRVLQSQDLSVLSCSQQALLWFSWGFGCVQEYPLGLSRLNLIRFEILRGNRLRRFFWQSTISLEQWHLLHND